MKINYNGNVYQFWTYKKTDIVLSTNISSLRILVTIESLKGISNPKKFQITMISFVFLIHKI